MTIFNSTTVSIIVPCYNEEKTIALLLAAIERQTYTRSALEVVIADGDLADGTRNEIAAFQERHPELTIKIVDNPKRTIPSGLNLAIQASTGQIIVRLDAHSIPADDYVALSVANLEAKNGENVGGVWQIIPGSSSWIGRSIAIAASHKLGVGDAQYRFTEVAQVVDTVPFGAFYRSLLSKIGGFDETLLSNEDYEFNVRVRQSGGKVFLDPQIRSQYFSRANLSALSRQYWRYGYWKYRMLRRYPKTLRWRQALPPLFVIGILGLVIFSLFFGWARWVLFASLILYFFVLIVGSLPAAFRNHQPELAVGIPLAIITMHFSWGLGFLYSIFRRDR